MRPTIPNVSGNRGFSIVEIMVGLAIGLVSMLIVMQVFATFEGQKRTTTSGADAQTNGGLALYTMERDLRMAGYGLNASVGCTLLTSQPMPPSFSNTKLMPVRIDDGDTLSPGNPAGTVPDSITLFSSDKPDWSVPNRYIPPAGLSTFVPSTQAFLTSTVGIENNDMLIIYGDDTSTTPTIPTCTLFQVNRIDTTDPVHPYLVHDAGDWNQTISGTPTYTSTAQLMDLGNFVGHNYSLDASGNLVFKSYCATNDNSYSLCPASQNIASSQIQASDIVNLQAQYGFDTRTGTQSTVMVDTWSDTMMDANNDGSIGDSGDIRRLYAVRFAIVARSGLKEKPNPVTGTCDTTTNYSIPWSGGTMDIRYNNPDWQCYRYKTFEMVVPLRNLIW